MRTNITRDVQHSMRRSMGLKKETQSQELAAAAKGERVACSLDIKGGHGASDGMRTRTKNFNLFKFCSIRLSYLIGFM
jgi:hypothetical protein